MKCVILAGGYGTRISEETALRPKPMIELGGKPILWHILKIYSAYGIDEFVICLGYKGYVIKEYFKNYALHNSDVTFDISSNEMRLHTAETEPWKVTLVDTGEHSMTGGRLKRVRSYIEDGDFCFTYGDGVADVDIGALVSFHREHQGLASVTAVQPPSRWGTLTLKDHRVEAIREKSQVGEGWINGGFFVLSPKVLDTIDGDQTVWEREPMERLAAQGQLHAFKHDGFWSGMDTLRDKLFLDELWESGKAPWKVW